MRAITCLLLVSVLNGEATDKRIVGGKRAKIGDYPFQVSIRRSYNDQHFCGGSIITSRHILTAAHCMYYLWGGIVSEELVSVIAGQITLNVSQATIFGNASEIFIHPNYNHLIELNNDIAVIKLIENLPINGKLIKSIQLSSFTPENAASCLISGWGYQLFDLPSVSNELLVAEVKIFNFSVCAERYSQINVTLSKEMMCASNDEEVADACQGDSGGPLVCNGKLAGIISTGKGCGDSMFPGIYTDVSYFVPWIESIVSETKPTEEESSEESNSIEGSPLPSKNYQNISNVQTNTAIALISGNIFILVTVFIFM